MKKIFTIVACLTVALLAFSSCEKTGEVGKVTYVLNTYTNALNNEDIPAWQAIEKNYTSELEAVKGVSREAGKKFVMEGNYSQCDRAIKAACIVAEHNSASYTLKSGFTLEVTAAYAVGEVSSATIYSHKFGN